MQSQFGRGFGQEDGAVPCSGDVSFAVPSDIPNPSAWRNPWLCLVRDFKPPFQAL